MYCMADVKVPCPVCGDMVGPRFEGSLWCVDCTADVLAEQLRDDSVFVKRQVFSGRLA